ncbi:glucose-1-phosphate adenylyltransferase [Paenibacillus sp. SYP-B3998]|uniref:Glucose-1-phosphate adenylyltransferase n=1 Tax=Paenibacillus sp. SYP-B3998 TaxID=2678564 RepID=A0A6G3ZWM2_9BACL|nr:glucose-1-phosphate adenylyltransferase [Paenibacillus sp. SYP-B3998]NEW05989.1 glucose-1-phosphate adenylyltransferase [Paenibacillus sp. SYP-B3998]
MRSKECVAMLLAGGEGRRLGVLTKNLAKPAVHFGGKYRIIDFTLSNCTNSGIDTVGVLTQYQPLVLNSYIGIGSSWDLDRKYGGVTVLPPFMEQKGGDWYKGTANAIYQNIGFIEQHDPEYVLVISGDHIYKMNYDLMLDYHKQKKADATIAVIEVKWEETNRFGIMSVNDQQEITEFAEKPKEANSNLASMGIYIFNWSVLKSYLIKDEENPHSSKDFGKDIIPLMLKDEARMFAYPFEGYWKDVGTIGSLWEANMDLLDDKNELNLNDKNWRVYSPNPYQPAQYIAPMANVRRSLVNEGCAIFGDVDHSVLFYGVQVGEGTVIRDSVIMPNAKIGSHVTIHKAIIGENTIVEDGANIDGKGEIVLIGGNERVEGIQIRRDEFK